MVGQFWLGLEGMGNGMIKGRRRVEKSEVTQMSSWMEVSWPHLESGRHREYKRKEESVPVWGGWGKSRWVGESRNFTENLAGMSVSFPPASAPLPTPLTSFQGWHTVICCCSVTLGQWKTLALQCHWFRFPYLKHLLSDYFMEKIL